MLRLQQNKNLVPQLDSHGINPILQFDKNKNVHGGIQLHNFASFAHSCQTSL